MASDLFDEKKGAPMSQWHKEVKRLFTDPELLIARTYLETWFDKFVDRDGHFIKEFQKQFYPRFWELYLHNVFKCLGYVFDFSKARPDLDFRFPHKLYMEATTANVKAGGKAIVDITFEDKLSLPSPPYKIKNFKNELEESICRISNAFLSKADMYYKYAGDSDFKKDNPYVIAIASFDQVNYLREYIYPLMALLYGRFFNPQTNKYKIIDFIKKPMTDADIPLGLFKTPKFKHVSAILFSSTLSIDRLFAETKQFIEQPERDIFCVRYDYDKNKYHGHFVGAKGKSKDGFICEPVNRTDGLYVFYNPYADNPLPEDMFKSILLTEVVVEDEKNVITKSHTPELVSLMSYQSKFTNNSILKHFRIEIADYNCDTIPTEKIDFSKQWGVSWICVSPDKNCNPIEQCMYFPMDILRCQEVLDKHINEQPNEKFPFFYIKSEEEFEKYAEKYRMFPFKEFAFGFPGEDD